MASSPIGVDKIVCAEELKTVPVLGQTSREKEQETSLRWAS